MKLGDVYIPNKGYSERNTNEFYPTAPIATLSLLRNYPVPHRIWEPAAGRGHISKELIRNGHEVVSTDLYDYDDPLVPVQGGTDFLTSPKMDVDGVITNPPFKGNLPEKLIYRMLEDHRYPFLALFVRLTFMESARRYKLFVEHPPTMIMPFSERIQCNERFFAKNHGLGGMVAYAWFVWDRTKTTSNRIEWILPSRYIPELEAT